MQHSPTNIKLRIEGIDALKGIALLAITLRHFLERYNFPVDQPETTTAVLSVSFLERMDYHLLTGKVYPIFALLFGLTLYVISQKKEEGSGSSLAYRLLGLIVFAVIDSLFFPSGDILGLYIIIGLFSLLMINLPPKNLLLIAAIFLLQPLEWVRYIYASPAQESDWIHQAFISLRGQLDTLALSNGLLQNLWANVTTGQLSGLAWALDTGRFSQTFGIIILGIYLGKTGILGNAFKKARHNVAWLLVPALMAACLFLFKRQISEATFSDVLLQQILFNWLSLSVASGYLLAFVFFYNRLWARFTPYLKCYGRMSLSNYLLQSVIGGVLFAPYLLNWGASLSSTAIVGLFIITVSAQILFSIYWLNARQYGPSEFYWRKLSFLKASKGSNQFVVNNNT